MTKDQALKLALKALKKCRYRSLADEIVDPAITAINEALAQPEQEPVAWMFQHDETGRMNYVSNDGIHNPIMFLEMNPRYALVCPLYTAPPQRKPLTDEQVGEIYYGITHQRATISGSWIKTFARAIEAAHGIK
jgi:hypothetical protein